MTVVIRVGFVSFCVPKSPPVFFTVVGLYLWIFFSSLRTGKSAKCLFHGSTV